MRRCEANAFMLYLRFCIRAIQIGVSSYVRIELRLQDALRS